MISIFVIIVQNKFIFRHSLDWIKEDVSLEVGSSRELVSALVRSCTKWKIYANLQENIEKLCDISNFCKPDSRGYCFHRKVYLIEERIQVENKVKLTRESRM